MLASTTVFKPSNTVLLPRQVKKPAADVSDKIMSSSEEVSNGGGGEVCNSKGEEALNGEGDDDDIEYSVCHLH